ncbi:hypothetical protein Tco_0978594 [Tanacetum coccineum]|uniref:Protein kinase-like domain, concanavalin A-like lectin/glucanase domain protein n=1 Tax=Tanacetum coccineum TaxID=301880 RepID=A0ABQ5EPH5_9ASTR
MTNPLEPRKDPKSPSRISNFTGRIRGMPIFSNSELAFRYGRRKFQESGSTLDIGQDKKRGVEYIDIRLHIPQRNLFLLDKQKLVSQVSAVLIDTVLMLTGAAPGNFTYALDFMIVEDISSVIDHRMSPVVLGKPFVEIANMTYDLSLGVVKSTNEIEEITYKMAYKIEQYDSLSDMEKENTKSVYSRNKEDKKRGVEYVMSKILGFYKGCLELGPEYRIGPEESGSGSDMNNKRGVT